ncbi:hypothetical protein [Kosakonia arachidis]|nr:hypothetical protein [Kosakonia arachidis]
MRKPICMSTAKQKKGFAPDPVIDGEQASGVVTTLDGGRPGSSSHILASSSPFLHEQALGILNR